MELQVKSFQLPLLLIIADLGLGDIYTLSLFKVPILLQDLKHSNFFCIIQ